jgi:hypothetical protein
LPTGCGKADGGRDALVQRGYCFHPNARETVYNSNMVLYFLKSFDREECAYSERMLGDNIASDYGKLMGVFKITAIKLSRYPKSHAFSAAYGSSVADVPRMIFGVDFSLFCSY